MGEPADPIPDAGGEAAAEGPADSAGAAPDTAADAPDPSSGDISQSLLLAGLGALSLTREKAEAVVDELVRRGSADKAPGDSSDRPAAPPRFGGERLVDRASSALAGLFRELGLVTEPTVDELELRIAQLEHRLRILERRAAPTGKSPPSRKTQP